MRIGVTGIFASGKGTVCDMFCELGADVIDTDLVAREIVEPGSDGLEIIVREFGDNFLNKDGSLNRREFGQFIFKDKDKVDRLNEITHPVILDIVLNRSKGNAVYMVNTPLLFESGFNKYMDKNIVVIADTKQVISRGQKRDNITENEIRERLSHQISLNEKMKFADYVIDNSGSLDNTKRQVVKLWNTLKDHTGK